MLTTIMQSCARAQMLVAKGHVYARCIILNTKLSTKCVFDTCSEFAEIDRQTACQRCKSRCAREDWYASYFVILTWLLDAQPLNIKENSTARVQTAQSAANVGPCK